MQTILRIPRVDRLCARKAGIPALDIWISPNLNFTALSKNIRSLLIIHDLSFEIMPETFSWKRRLWHWVLQPKKQCRRADIIITPSHHTKQDVARIYGKDEAAIHVVPPGVSDTSAHTPAQEVKKKYHLPDTYFFYLGTIEPRKNILGMLEAFSSLKKNEPALEDVELIIAGAHGWKYEDIRQAIETTDNVRYIGYVPNADKRALFACARACVYPSLYEGFGLPVLEAMAAGTPVITSNRSSLPEVAADAAYLVNPYNTEEITAAMKALAMNDALHAWYRARVKERAALFTWEKSMQQFCEKTIDI